MNQKLTICIFSKLGGGGVGKTFLIKLLSQWIDYILQEAGDVTYYPKVIRLAATGNAAYLIGKFIIKYFMNKNIDWWFTNKLFN